jgi:hypothetical protein
MGDRVNVIIDDLSILLTRILSLPMVFQIFLWLMVNLGAWYLAFRLLGFFSKPLSTQAKRWFFSTSVFISLITGIVVALDYRNFQAEVGQDNLYQPHNDHVIQDVDSNASSMRSLVSLPSFPGVGGDLTFAQVYRDTALEVMKVSSKEPLFVAWLAKLDLRKFEVILDTAIAQKELTSVFGKRFNVDVAVNGEAGETPGIHAPLGQWTGAYVVNGKVLKNSDSKRRPFVYFNQNSKGYYSHEQQIIQSFGKEHYNVIWGRYDLLRAGKLSISPHDASRGNPYPRTIVGIDSTGFTAFLLIADGRKPTHSMGLTMEQCGLILQKVGCFEAMACDQGGSSVMYLKKNGIISRPADGRERVVYSHLGFRRK